MITKKWDKIRSGSKITLEKDTLMFGMNKETKTLLKGIYYIVGFWADLCGLSKDKKDIRSSYSQVFIQSPELKKFKNII